MRFTRRQTLGLAGSALAGTLIGSEPARAAAPGEIKAVAFDAFPVFDPRPIFALVETIAPQRGKELGNLWRTRQFEYTWLRTISNQYENFWKVTQDALLYAARALKIELTPQQIETIMGAYLDLKAWPEAREALGALREAGLRLGFVSNFTSNMLQSAIKNAELDGYFEQVLSTDAVRRFKPDASAYRMAMEGFGLEREEILFVPFAGWDAAGAKWFGYETFWVNRLGTPPEELGVVADATGANLSDLVRFLGAKG
ncbi:MAG: haloacid dehalogenase type II [Methyloceanibacter sp.]|jgi:2-haloacid dehalogenase